MRSRALALVAAAAGLGATAVLLLSPGLGLGDQSSPGGTDPAAGQVARGRSLFLAGCSSCHGYRAGGIRGVAPSLHGVGALAADFYLRSGRMPLTSPDQQPSRSKPAYSPDEIAALDAYIGSLGGPGIPRVVEHGTSLSYGQTLFADSCSGCHQAAARGGIVTGAFVPAMTASTAREIVEAARIGPYLMPRFGPRLLTDRQLGAIAHYIHYVQHPPNRGGWGIGEIGPVPEGMVVWFIAIPFVLLVTRLIGERTES